MEHSSKPSRRPRPNYLYLRTSSNQEDCGFSPGESGTSPLGRVAGDRTGLVGWVSIALFGDGMRCAMYWLYQEVRAG